MKFTLKNVVAGLFTILFVKSAAAIPLNTENAGVFASTHCRLMLKTLGDTRPLLDNVLDDIIGKNGYARQQGRDTSLRVLQSTGGYPDMGFILGEPFNTATRKQRQNFNVGISQYILREHNIINPVMQPSASPVNYADQCHMSLHVRLLVDKEIDLSEVRSGKYIFPMKPAFRAEAKTSLPTRKNGVAHVKYELERITPYGWKIREIYINGRGTKTSLERQALTRLHAGGFAALEEWLAASAKNTLPEKTN